MRPKEFLLNRLRDFDAALHAERKWNALRFVLLRQVAKALGVPEERIAAGVAANAVTLRGKRFLTRAGGIDLLYCSRFYEPETTAFVLAHPGDTLVIAGGHIGRYAILAAEAFREVIAFEPHPQNYEQLRKNLELNRCANVTAVNIGLSERPGSATMSPPGANTGAAALRTDAAGIPVALDSLDAYAGRTGLDPARVALLLVDVEGHEMSVVAGASRFLRATRAVLVIESFAPEPLAATLAGHGYALARSLDVRNHVFEKQPEARR